MKEKKVRPSPFIETIKRLMSSIDIGAFLTSILLLLLVCLIILGGIKLEYLR